MQRATQPAPMKDVTMYQDELYHEAALIVRGREAFLVEAMRSWARFCAWLGLPAR